MSEVAAAEPTAGGAAGTQPTKQPRMDLDLLQKLRKCDLHRHLDGSVRVSTVLDLAAEHGVELPSTDLDTLRGMIEVGADCESLEQYLKAFAIVLTVMQQPAALTRIMYEVCEDAARDGLTYLEVRFAPILHVNESLSLSGVMEAVIDGKELAEEYLPITVRVIVCGMRHMSAETTNAVAEVAWRYRRKGVTAFDLAGPEIGYSSRNHRQAFELIRQRCLNCTIHSGEAFGWQSIQDSIRFCGAQRIGHGVRLKESKSLLRYVIDRRIPLEMCVTSNVQTKAVATLDQHPIQEYFDQGVIVIPCCDNTTMSNVKLSTELDVICTTWNFTTEAIIRMLDYGFQYAFLDNSKKRRLRASALRHNLLLLHARGFDMSQVVDNYCAYYMDAGVDVPRLLAAAAAGPSRLLTQPPPLTKALVQMLPKTDLHCRLDGSVSIELVWDELQRSSIKLDELLAPYPTIERVENLDDLRNMMQPEKHTEETRRASKLIFNSVLQTREQIERGVRDVVQDAQSDNVRYLELVVRPTAHLDKGLTMEQVLSIVLTTVDNVIACSTAVQPIHVGVLVAVSTGDDDPIAFRDVAELAIRHKQKPGTHTTGVCGFGAYGDQDIAAEDIKYYQSTFDLLKKRHVNVAMTAGKQTYLSISSAVHQGGAVRLSGCYQIHRHVPTMTYTGNHQIPLELGATRQLKARTSDLKRFVSHPFRLFLDANLCITWCSFRKSHSRFSRADELLHIAQKSQYSAADLLKLLSNGFRFNMQSYHTRKEMYTSFWRDSEALMKVNGYDHLVPMTYFPDSQPESL